MYNPNLSCSSLSPVFQEGDDMIDKISKQFDSLQDAMYEQRFNILYERIDPSPREFTIKSFGCCTAFVDGHEHAQIIYAYGGESLASGHAGFVHVFCDMWSVFNGLIRLKHANYAHMNICTSSIVHAPDMAKTYLINLTSTMHMNNIQESNRSIPWKLFMEENFTHTRLSKVPMDLRVDLDEIANQYNVNIRVANDNIDVCMLGLSILQLFLESLDVGIDITGDTTFYKDMLHLVFSMIHMKCGAENAFKLYDAAKYNLFERMNSHSEYVAKGSYGCVFSPQIPCKLKTNPNVRTVSKVFLSRKDANVELSMSTMLNDIDPSHSFTVRTYGQCLAMVDPENREFTKCRKLVPGNIYDQIVFQHGGRTLNDPSLHFYHILYALSSIFEGLVILEDHHVIHMDIKPDNMVYDSNEGRVRLIDFGLSSDPTDVYQTNMYIQWMTNKWSPPEFRAVYRMTHQSEKKRQNMSSFSQFMSQTFDETTYNIIPPELLTRFDQMCHRTDIFTDEYHTHHAQDLNAFCSRNVSKIDVYMLGLSLLSLFLENLRVHGIVYSHIRDENAHDFHSRMFELITEMTHLDPNVRCSASRALFMYSSLVDTNNYKSDS